MSIINELIARFQLQPHPEGGWYRQTYKSAERIAAAALPERFGGDRPLSTAIFFLLPQGEFSAFHRIKSDECWHFYGGDALHIYVLHPDGLLQVVTLGSRWEEGEELQYVVPAGCWFASRPAMGSAWSLVGCTVSPGFDFADFELARKDELITAFPVHHELITELCRP